MNYKYSLIIINSNMSEIYLKYLFLRLHVTQNKEPIDCRSGPNLIAVNKLGGVATLVPDPLRATPTTRPNSHICNQQSEPIRFLCNSFYFGSVKLFRFGSISKNF